MWAYGGFGDPMGLGFVEGVFKVNLSNSTSSNQLRLAQDFQQASGLACDGTNLFICNADSMEVGGIVKFNPDLVTEVPSNLFISLSDRVRSFTYGDNILWVGVDRINKFNAATSEYLGNVEIPGFAADIFFDSKFWAYDETNNTLKVYYLSTVNVDEKNVLGSTEDFTLSQNYPNPFNPSTSIQYAISSSQFITLKVYDVLGKEVATLINEEKPMGSYDINFDASNLSSGIYFYTIKAGKFIETKKLILMK